MVEVHKVKVKYGPSTVRGKWIQGSACNQETFSN